MRILYLTQFFDPEPMIKGAQFARGLADRGHDVEVVTGFPNYPGGKIYPGFRVRPYRREVIDDITVHRVPLYPSHSNNSLGRIFNYMSFFLSALLFGLLRAGRYDAVYVYHPPLTPALAASLFCRWHKKPLTIEIQDLWPDTVAASGMANPRIVATLNRLCSFVYRSADRIIAQSPGMRDKIASRGVPDDKLTVIFNWATYLPAAPDRNQPIRDDIAQAFAGHFNIVFGGNLGQAQNLDILVDAAIIARKSVPTLRFHLVGDGIARMALEAQIAATHASDIVRIHPPVNRLAMDRVFDAADLLALHLNDDPLYNITIPSKTQHYLACGKPIVAGIGGVAAEILDASGAAIIRPPLDVAGIAAAMVKLAAMSPDQRRDMGQRGRLHYEKQFAFDQAITKTLDVIEQANYGQHQKSP